MSYYIVRIVQGPKVLLSNTVVQLDSDKSFLDLFEKSVATNAQVDRAEISVDKILKASLGNMKDNVVSFNIDVPVADLRTPVSLADRCQQNGKAVDLTLVYRLISNYSSVKLYASK